MEKWYLIDPYTWVVFFSNMVFQNEYFESITYLNPPYLPMPKFATCTTFFLQSIEPTPNAPKT
jgi:hypothetical protein